MSELDELKTSIDALTGGIGAQNDLLADLPEALFKLNILWKVFCIVCGATLVGFLGWLGHLIVSNGAT
tara:strand:+ start:231 stop:434 length:204 start_codon:yes stop_codon:yes gene_type:complete